MLLNSYFYDLDSFFHRIFQNSTFSILPMGNRVFASVKNLSIIVEEYGKPSGVETRELGKCELNQVMVKMSYSGMNYMDVLIQSGFFKMLFRPKFPYTMGQEGSGVVVEVGSNVSTVKIGDRVFGCNQKGGTHAQYCVFDAKTISTIPENVSMQVAASIPVSGLIALDSLVEIGKIKKGEKVMIIGASGAVGTNLIQLAKLYNAEVYAISRTDHLGYVKHLGADHIFDYTKSDFSDDIVDDVNLIIDCVGALEYRRTLSKFLKSRGKYIQVGYSAQEERFGVKKFIKLASTRVYNVVFGLLGHSTFHVASISPSKQKLDYLADLVSKNILKPQISEIHTFSNYLNGYQILETRHSIGKRILKIDQ